ncbi:uncharacterized protein MYCFIDRAFT_138566 [Pseudocercospora fijiensis CIRAD86]|uniref:Heterokaryon incompatibility domain-containing protein n=1 Tax=Pseudocercospora fijiensis (strain CIRAD86) TaxID=383855 RepID=M3AAL1_PSEFD|nr:uncharacterized protein MYCFIDRAFT_138566 [Pseudocercospora fijiensis CIRAD86]EME81631.1 hypothetical protein MYCFIDRAFT_138566 [Pseudocercospora fijiensis CIRAD86]
MNGFAKLVEPGPLFRLYNMNTGDLELWPLDNHPDYIAASHTWSENVFSPSLAFENCFGGQGMQAVITDRYPDIHHAWFDTRCIDQNDPNDKLEQIPLMDRIFGNATCVVIFISRDLEIDQSSIDWLAERIEGALAMCLAEAWAEEGAYWQNGSGRRWITMAMEGLLRLASTSWATRIWTLQEYVLAKEILWIGTDLSPIKIDDYALSALPDICNTLAIEECLTPKFDVLHGYFAGMANARLKNIDQTRIMELPGNRSASVAVDEVYGVMAAAGVTVLPMADETKGQAWSRWCAEAINTGHLRWALLPASSCPLVDGEVGSCAFPRFLQRHKLSGISSLNHVTPLALSEAAHGVVTAHARVLGSVEITHRLGRVHEPKPGRIHRDITLIIFAKARWSLALTLAWTFGGAGLGTRQAKAIAQVLVQSYSRAIWSISQADEDNFRPMVSSNFQQRVWNDFMAMQQSHMLGLQEGVGYACHLARRDSPFPAIPAVLVTGYQPPAGSLQVLDLNARTPDGGVVLMIVQRDGSGGAKDNYHKVGMTLPLPEAVTRMIGIVPSQKVHIGSYDCSVCCRAEKATECVNIADIENAVKSLRQSTVRLLTRQQETLRIKLFSERPLLTRKGNQSVCTRINHRKLAAIFRLRQSKLMSHSRSQ